MSAYASARRYLDGVLAALASAGRPAFATSYVQIGGGALDREMCIARVMRGYRGLPAVPRVQVGNCVDPAAFDVDLCVLRACWPTSDDQGDPPAAAAIDAASQLLLDDWDIVVRYSATYSGFPDGGPPGAAMGLTEWLAPSGGLAGFTCAVAIPESFA